MSTSIPLRLLPVEELPAALGALLVSLPQPLAPLTALAAAEDAYRGGEAWFVQMRRAGATEAQLAAVEGAMERVRAGLTRKALSAGIVSGALHARCGRAPVAEVRRLVPATAA